MNQKRFPSTDRFIRLPEVLAIVGFKRTTLHNRIKAGEFPSPIKLGPQSVAWLESEVQDWMQSKIAESRSVTAEH
jgi:prophage regulatory protein